MIKTLAPIILFTYNRPRHTDKTLSALASNKLSSESILYIYSDAPRSDADNKKQLEVREVIDKYRKSFKELNVISSPKNKGLSKSVIEGVTEICREHGRAIVLEDDVVTNPNFLDYMNKCLDKYESCTKVMAISGYIHASPISHGDDVLFLPYISSWGWGTWKRAWDLFDESQEYFDNLRGKKDLIYKFNLNGKYPFYEMLEKKYNGKIDSWAISWYANLYFNNGLSIFPRSSLTINIGLDGTGENCKVRSVNQSPLHNNSKDFYLPEVVEISDEFETIINSFPQPSVNLIATFNYINSKIKKLLGGWGKFTHFN